MSGDWQRSWSWRASLLWALLGPSVVLLVQVESALVVLDGLGAVSLPGELQRWPALIAGAVLVLVTAAQLSTAAWRRLGAARGRLSEDRRRGERRLADMVEHDPASGFPDDGPSGFTSPVGLRPLRALVYARPARLLDWQAGSWESLHRGHEPWLARRIIERFGLEPSWAFQQLDENLGVPAARRLTRRSQVADARWAGQVTALVFVCIAFVLLPLGLTYLTDLRTPVLVVIVLLGVLALGRLVAAGAAGRAVIIDETRFYPQVEALLELHRFDLYRALGVQSPHDSTQEQSGWISAWRQGSGRVTFEHGEARDDSDVRQRVAGLTELLRGPELVPYEGYVSWEAGDDQVELAFARTPILRGGHARLQVAGSDGAAFAPFDITADSTGVALVQVRASVQAPVDGGTARTTFDFDRSTTGAETTEVWFEISQRGRFVQLLRVRAPAPSGERKGPG